MRTIENTLFLEKGTYFTLHTVYLHGIPVVCLDVNEFEEEETEKLYAVLQPTATTMGLSSSIFRVLFQRAPRRLAEVEQRIRYFLSDLTKFGFSNSKPSKKKQGSSGHGGSRPAYCACVPLEDLHVLLNLLDERYVRNEEAARHLLTLQKVIDKLIRVYFNKGKDLSLSRLHKISLSEEEEQDIEAEILRLFKRKTKVREHTRTIVEIDGVLLSDMSVLELLQLERKEADKKKSDPEILALIRKHTNRKLRKLLD